MTVEEDQALSRAEYWDGRYQDSRDEAQVHEWFRGFSDLQPFFEKNLFTVQPLRPEDNPFILHLGSGDSVRALPITFVSSHH